jgi:subtilase family serine protease
LRHGLINVDKKRRVLNYDTVSRNRGEIKGTYSGASIKNLNNSNIIQSRPKKRKAQEMKNINTAKDKYAAYRSNISNLQGKAHAIIL